MKVQLLPAGIELVKWIQQGGKPDRATFGALWLYRWQSFWANKNHLAHLRAVQNDISSDSRLIFIMGFWRSGTTWLHEYISSGAHMVAPKTWQCFRPLDFKLCRPPGVDAASVRRPMDEVEVGPHSPQEDEIALLAFGVPSLYRAWIDPRRWRECLPVLDQETWLNQKDWISHWQHFLSACSNNSEQRMVIKSPNHVFRFKAIQALWPHSHMLWVLRNPWAMWHSNVRMWRAMVDRYALWHASPGDIEGLLYHAALSYLELLRDLRRQPPDSVIFLSYERMLMAPEEVLAQALDRVGLDFAAWPMPKLQTPSFNAAFRAEPSQNAPPKTGPVLEAIHQEQQYLLASSLQ